MGRQGQTLQRSPLLGCGFPLVQECIRELVLLTQHPERRKFLPPSNTSAPMGPSTVITCSGVDGVTTISAHQEVIPVEQPNRLQ